MELLRIVIDGNEANCGQRVGSNVYAWHILRELEMITRSTPHISCTVLLSKPKQAHMPERRTGWRYQVLSPRPFWTQWALPIHLYLNSKRYDVFYTPGHYAPRYSAIPYVSSVMDTAYLIYPDQFRPSDAVKLTKWTAYSVKHAAKVIAISQFTKDEVIRHYQKPAKDVEIAYPSIDQPVHLVPAEAAERVAALGVKGAYFLYVGTIQPRKNLVRLIEGFEEFCRRQEERQSGGNQMLDLPQLVIAGKIGWLAQPLIERIKESPYHALIVTPGYVDDRTKAALYMQARASLLLGLYEGFGIPALESLEYGCIPIVSNTTSLPEVVGQAGLLVDPLNVGEIAQAMSDVTSMSRTVVAHWRRRGRDQLRKYSWNASAKVILSTLNQVAQQNRFA